MSTFQPHLHSVATQRALPFVHELYVDLFAGAGGARSGGARVYRDPDIAINHNPIAIAIAIAIAVHRANHRITRHYITGVFEVDSLEAVGCLIEAQAAAYGRTWRPILPLELRLAAEKK
ncbi:hypothetical protein [Pseudomonas boanensis]|uniref:hypothetical protein n=1 Tax=Metapseudomonas boanensis TaxID=2822138 RepID=UPI0035D43B53